MTDAIQKQEGRTATIRTLLESKREALEELIPEHMDTDRLLKVALNCIAKSPKLQQCTPGSLLQCLITSAELGLEPGGALGGAYLVPHKETATLIVGYRGFIDLMRRSGQIATVRAVVVREGDKFLFREGLEQTIEHEPKLEGEPGKFRFVYAVVKFKSGDYQVEFMSKSAVDAVRARSKSRDDGPWVTDYDEMAKKTVVRRIAKYMPMSKELERAEDLDKADFVDGEVVGRAETLQLADEVVSGHQTARSAKAKVRKLLISEVPANQVGEALVQRLREKELENATSDHPPTPTDADAPPEVTT